MGIDKHVPSCRVSSSMSSAAGDGVRGPGVTWGKQAPGTGPGPRPVSLSCRLPEGICFAMAFGAEMLSLSTNHIQGN